MNRTLRWLAAGLATLVLVAGAAASGGRSVLAGHPDQNRTVAASAHTLFLPYTVQRIVPHLTRIGQLGGSAYAVAYSTPYLYLASGPRILTVDVADPVSPRVIARSEVLPGVVARVAAARGHLLVVIDRGNGDNLLVVDIADPRRVTVAGTFPLPGPVGDVEIVGSRAYVAVPAVGVFVFDVADPLHLREVGHVSTGGHLTGVAAGDRYVAVTDYDNDPEMQTQHVLDVADPRHIVEVRALARNDTYPSSAFVGDYLYTVAGSNGMSVYAPPTFERVATLADVPGLDIAVHGQYAFVVGEFTADHGPVAVLDVSHPARPRRIDTCVPDAGTACGRIAAGGLATAPGWLFVTDSASGGAGVRMVDMRNPEHPKLTGDLALLGTACNGILADDGNVFVFDDDAQAIHIVTMSEPEAPTVIGSIPAVWQSRLAVRDGFAYRVGFWENGHMSTLEVVDVRRPSHPHRVAALTWPDGRQLTDVAWEGAVALVGGTVYLGDDAKRPRGFLAVLDTTDPAAPLEVASLGPFDGSISAVESAAGFGYVVTRVSPGSAGSYVYRNVAHVVDMRQPANARVVGEVVIDGEATGADLCRGMLFLTSDYGSNGDFVVDVRDPVRPMLVGETGDAHRPGWACSGNTAYAVRRGYPDETGSVSVIDLSDPLEPRPVARFTDIAFPSALTGDDHHLYVADCSGGLEVLRIER
jgi:hypothetical protein